MLTRHRLDRGRMKSDRPPSPSRRPAATTNMCVANIRNIANIANIENIENIWNIRNIRNIGNIRNVENV